MHLPKLLLLIVCAAGPAFAGPYEDGKAAYEKGDYTTALRLFRPLAEQGDDYAQFSVGQLYFSGKGVPQDYAAALSWYRKAADRGNPYAQNNLGGMYLNGRGVPLDYVEAYMWYSLSAARYPAYEKKAREDAAKTRDLIAAKMTSAQLAEAQKLAREWKPVPKR